MLAAALLACALMTATPGWAAPPDPKVTPLVLMPISGPAASAELTTEVEQALSQLGRPAQRSALKLEELMLAVECNKPTIACLQKIGTNIQVDGLILGQARVAAGGVELTLRWFDVKSGGDLGKAATLLPPGKSPAREQALKKAARELLGIKIAPPPSSAAVGGLAISSSVEYAEIILDGQARGTTPLELRNLKTGSYHVEAKRAGYVTWQGKAEVKADQMTKLEIEMAPSAATADAPGFMQSIRLRTWIVAGVGAACLGAGIAVGAHLNALQSEMDGLAGDTFDEIARMQELKDDGESEAVAANVLLGVGGAALVTAAVLAYLDYSRGGRSVAEEPASAPPPDGDKAPAKSAATSTELLVGPTSLGLRIAF
jgi:PEGA domain